MRNMEIQKFDFNGKGITAITDEKGNPWFVGNEVAKILGYKYPKNAVQDHCKYVKLLRGDKSTPLTSNPFGINIIPESDLYRLIVKSRLPEAEEFERWVMEEVLPQIRKTGGYIPVEEGMSDMEIMARAVLIGQKTMEEQKKTIREQQEKINCQQDRIDFQEKKIRRDAPKVQLAEHFIKDNIFEYTLRHAAKQLGLRPNHFTLALRNRGFLFYENRINIPYQQYINSGLFIVRHFETPAGELIPQTFMTPKGLDYFRNKIAKRMFIQPE